MFVAEWMKGRGGGEKGGGLPLHLAGSALSGAVGVKAQEELTGSHGTGRRFVDLEAERA